MGNDLEELSEKMEHDWLRRPRNLEPEGDDS